MIPLSSPRMRIGAALAVLSSPATPAAAEVDALASAGWTTPLDHYCERLGPGFWAEPLNALSNIAFLIAAAAILSQQSRALWKDRAVIALALLGALVGVGSFLFHTLANRWTLIADMLPIAMFIYAYFLVALRRFLLLGALAAGLVTLALLLLSPAIEQLMRPVLGGSAAYAPGLAATFGVALSVPLLGRGPVPRLLLAAGLAFAVALSFRMLDHTVCDTWPTGTHFLWHLSNAVAIGVALLAAERAGPERAKARLASTRPRPSSLEIVAPGHPARLPGGGCTARASTFGSSGLLPH